MRIYIEDTSGSRFECDVEESTLIARLADDFFEIMGWTEHDSTGRGQRAVVELVKKTASVLGKKSKRLDSGQTLADADIQEGAVLRIFPESIGGGNWDIDHQGQLSSMSVGDQQLAEGRQFEVQMVFLRTRKADYWRASSHDSAVTLKELADAFIFENYSQLREKIRPAIISKSNKQLLPLHFSVDRAALQENDTLIVGEESLIYNLLPYLDQIGNLPNEILMRGYDNTINYIRNLLKPQDLDLTLNPNEERNSRKLNECKLVFIGNGNVGKTSLIKWITEGAFDPHEPQTQRIAIRKWYVHLNKLGNIRLNIWDFGGQDIMHSVHQMFLTRRSVYVLVTTPRADGVYGIEYELNYWLELINNQAPNAPIIIAINKCETNICNISKWALKGKFPQIIDFVETSCLEKINRDSLIELISEGISKLPHLQDEVPNVFIEIKNKLEEFAKDVLPYYQYITICREVDKKLSDESIGTLAGLLHDLGIMLNYSSNSFSKETQVLNPEWITGGIYSIINSDQLLEKGGILSKMEIRAILSISDYERIEDQDFILSLMQRFKLCYLVVQNDVENYFFPAGFPADRPAQVSPPTLGVLHFQFKYSLLPPFLISTFIVENQRFIKQDSYWRNGCVLKDKEEGLEALIESNPLENYIFIFVSGEGNRRAFLRLIRESFHSIHNTFPRLRVEQMIPVDPQNGIYVSYDVLRAYQESKESTYFSPETKRRYDVNELLGFINDPFRGDKISMTKELSAMEEKLEDIKGLLANESLDNIFLKLKQIPDLHKSEQNDFILLEGSYIDAKNNFHRDLLTEELFRRELNRIRWALINFIDKS